jgi:hypothetical protein
MDLCETWLVMHLMHLMGLFSFWISFTKFTTLFTRVFSFVHKIMKGNCNAWILVSFNVLVTTGSLISFILVLSWVYSYAFSTPNSMIKSYEINGETNSSQLQVQSYVSRDACNVFDGRWIQDDSYNYSYPLYDASQCPFAEKGFNCFANGRKDRGYTKWRWKPNNCDIPRFDARRILEQLRGKRVVFVGDSLSRTQWESLICMLMTGVENKKSVYEIKGNKITKQIRFLGVRFSSFDVRIDFYRSVFLVKPGPVPKFAPKRVKTTLRLDKIDDISHEWIDSDVLIFNSGHWWTRTKLFDM